MGAGLTVAMFVLLSAVSTAWAQDQAAERVVSLDGGGRVVLRADGSMGHYAANGAPIEMKEGEVMIAADGGRIIMRRNALWRQIVEEAAYLYGRASEWPAGSSAPADRKIDLADDGWILIRANGAMAHFDRHGQPIAMPDGTVMAAKDGTRIIMTNGALWSSTLSLPGKPANADRRSK